MAEVAFNPYGYKTLDKFLKSDAYVRVIIGPAGSAKTSCCAQEILRLAMTQQANAKGIRETICVVTRNTMTQLETNTVPAFRRVLGEELFKITKVKPALTGMIELRMNDGTQVKCKLLFISMDNEQSADKAIGSENTFVFMDEISLLGREAFDRLLQRNGRFPPRDKKTGFGGATFNCIIGTTNGARQGGWFHELYLEQAKLNEEMAALEIDGKRPYAGGRYSKFIEFFEQPPALIRPQERKGHISEIEWKENPEAEGVDYHAEGYGYWYKMLSGRESDIKSMVEGKFYDVNSGLPVFRQFDRALHTLPKSEALKINTKDYFLSFDFGRTPVCIMGILDNYGSLIIIEEFMGEDMSVSELMDNFVMPKLLRSYQGWNCVKAYCDPAGFTKGQNVGLSPVDVLQGFGLEVSKAFRSNRLEERLLAVRDRLGKLTFLNRAQLMIADNCTYLIAALAEGYVYEGVRGADKELSDKPTKTHTNWASDLADSLQYMCVGLKIDSDFKDTADKLKSKNNKIATGNYNWFS